LVCEKSFLLIVSKFIPETQYGESGLVRII
jgi:hypothetical protein